MTPDRRIEPIVRLLFAGIMVFTIALFVSAKFLPDDGQTFQVISQLIAGFSGAFFMRTKPRGTDPNQETSATTVTSGGAVTVETTKSNIEPAKDGK